MSVKFDLNLGGNVREQAKAAGAELAKLSGVADNAQKALDRARNPFAKLTEASKRFEKQQRKALDTTSDMEKNLKKAQKRLAELKANPQMAKELQKVNKELSKMSGSSGVLGAFKHGLGFKDFGILAAAEAAGHLLARGGEALVHIVKEGLKLAVEEAGKEERRQVSLRLMFGKKGAEEATKDAERFSAQTEFSPSENLDMMRPLMEAGMRGKALRQAYATALDLAARKGGGAENTQEMVGLMSKIALKEGVKGKQLMGLGLHPKAFFSGIAKTLKISEKEAEKRAATGSIDPQLLMNGITQMVEGQQGGAAGSGGKMMGDTLLARLHKIQGRLMDYFEALANSPAFTRISDSLEKVFKALDPEGPTGKRVIGALEKGLTKVADWVERAFTEENIEKFGVAVSEVIGFIEKIPEHLNTALKIAEAFAVIWAGSKIVGGISAVASALPMIASAASVIGPVIAASMAPLLQAAAVLVAAKAGWEAGKWIDKKTGASDWIASKASSWKDHDGEIVAPLKSMGSAPRASRGGMSMSNTNNISMSVFPAPDDTRHTSQQLSTVVASGASNGIERAMSEAGLD